MQRSASMSTFGREADEEWKRQRAELKIVSSNDEIGWRGHIKHASRLRDVRYPEPAYVVPGFIPEGLSILGGRPKVGKSWLALELALGVSLVETVLGKIMPESGDVLYAALEDTFPRLQRRIKKLLWPGRTSWPERLMLATQWRRLDEGGVEDIADWAQSVDAPRLVIHLDPPISRQQVAVYLNRLCKTGEATKEARGKFRRNTMKWASRDE